MISTRIKPRFVIFLRKAPTAQVMLEPNRRRHPRTMMAVANEISFIMTFSTVSIYTTPCLHDYASNLCANIPQH